MSLKWTSIIDIFHHVALDPKSPAGCQMHLCERWHQRVCVDVIYWRWIDVNGWILWRNAAHFKKCVPILWFLFRLYKSVAFLESMFPPHLAMMRFIYISASLWPSGLFRELGSLTGWLLIQGCSDPSSPPPGQELPLIGQWWVVRTFSGSVSRGFYVSIAEGIGPKGGWELHSQPCS